MAKNKKYLVYQIDLEGDLKFIYKLELDFLPRIGDTIALIIADENGNPNRRIYYKVRDVIVACINTDKDLITSSLSTPIIHVSLEIDEPIMHNS